MADRDPSPSTPDGASGGVRAIAYYLPQYHPIPENDEWWGKGFTEWTNVTRAKPLFAGHHQPHLPTELGFYDLRLPAVRVAQAELARAYGIHGFCYYYYSFGEKRLLERPLHDMIASETPDFPFCICWANETWSRRWDGAEAQTLIAQDDSEAFYRAEIERIIPILRDRRYVRVDGRPVLLVYRVGRIPNAAGVAAAWREAAVAAGLPGLYLCAVQSHDPFLDPRPHGFDAAVEFPPSPWGCREIDPATLPEMSPDFTGRVYDYPDFVTSRIARPAPEYRLMRGVMTDWDNTARRGAAAYLFPNATPREYETWLRASVAWTEAHNPPGERLVFVNAWNEWAEGAHLEPDARHGRAWLEATQRALTRANAWRGALEVLRRGDVADPAALRPYLDDIEHALSRLDRSVHEAIDRATLTEGTPPFLDAKPLTLDGLMHVDALQGERPQGRVTLRPGEPLRVAGWALPPGMDVSKSIGVVTLRSPTGVRTFSAPLPRRLPRHDVAFKHRRLKPACGKLGFDVELGTGELTPGEYRLGVVHADQRRVVAALSEHRVVVE